MLSNGDIVVTSFMLLDSQSSLWILDDLSLIGDLSLNITWKSGRISMWKHHCVAIAGTGRKVVLEEEDGPRLFLSQDQRPFARPVTVALSLHSIHPSHTQGYLSVTQPFPFNPRWFFLNFLNFFLNLQFSNLGHKLWLLLQAPTRMLPPSWSTPWFPCPSQVFGLVLSINYCNSSPPWVNITSGHTSPLCTSSLNPELCSSLLLRHPPMPPQSGHSINTEGRGDKERARGKNEEGKEASVNLRAFLPSSWSQFLSTAALGESEVNVGPVPWSFPQTFRLMLARGLW